MSFAFNGITTKVDIFQRTCLGPTPKAVVAPLYPPLDPSSSSSSSLAGNTTTIRPGMIRPM